MEALKEKLLKVINPQPMEIWLVDDSEIKMHEKGRQPKSVRPVLILCHDGMCATGWTAISAVPLSRSGKPDNVTVPMHGFYDECIDDWVPEKASVAVVPLYQPIRKGCFTKLVGKIRPDHYYTILSTLCDNVIGLGSFDTDLV